MLPRNHKLQLLHLFLGLGLLCGGLQAQTDAVYVANSSNNRILRILPGDFAAAPTIPKVVNTDANLRKQLQGLLVRGLNELIVCDTLDSKVLFYNTIPEDGEVIGKPITSDVPLPDGPSIGFDGSLFLVSSGPGSAGPKTREVWYIPFDRNQPLGYGTAMRIGPALSSELLEDTKVVRYRAEANGGPQPGDLLVLSRKPAKVWWYQQPNGCLGSCEPTTFIDSHDPEFPESPSNFPLDAAPTGFDFSLDGNLLISTAGGTILRYNIAERQFMDEFYTGLGMGTFKISVGVQTVDRGYIRRVYVADRNGGEVHRFQIGSDGTGSLDGTVTAEVQHPVGVAAATSNAPVVFEGEGQIALLQNLTAAFENIITRGFYTASCISFLDPREFLDPGVPPGEPLPDPLLLTDPNLPSALTDLELEAAIPPYVRAFRSGPDNEGPPTFRLCITDSNAVYEGVVEFDAELSPLGHECFESIPSPSEDPDFPFWDEGRMFYAPEPGPPKYEYATVEWPFFKDITVKCGTHIGWSRGRGSLILDTVRDVRPPREIIGFKLDQLEKALTSSGDDVPGGLADFILKNSVRRRLEKELRGAQRAFGRDDWPTLVRDLRGFIDVVESSTTHFDETVTAVSAELKERPASIIYMGCKLISGPKPDGCDLCEVFAGPSCSP